ncbi:DUF1819 family protein [Lacrimispora saccharolytica]|uniref:DUF1819 family protein n=1 Tax=Lacrimispora saccharolytica (strain ATCC 35040 / DSM 2544 / NRCC 2533 / WM1) TaxID=610130 RepID=D9R6C8_LACSW|nr:DUF1819 family protein [Lacrimispora saccharolytica]ADL05338.1 Protein of unknown function DUF1819 putative inner membrane [[Clostridium] saccharolyticum WM1]QRV20492.1 DUF1819 family protein [Lacrimispora saccharolytica]
MEKYSSGLVSESFWFIEFRKIIKLKHEGKTWDEIKDLCLTDNLLGISKEYRAKRNYGYLKNRIDALDTGLIQVFIHADLNTQKIINLIAIAKKNRLFFEFLYEVYREKVQMGAPELTESDINIFYKNKQGQDDDVSTWTDVTLRRLRSTYMNFLTDAGLLTVSGKEKKITPPILDITLENYLKDNGDNQMIKAITGVS